MTTLDELRSQIKIKERTVRDLLRFISTRTDQNPNYTLLLGAGSSITSGVRSATSLCDTWRREIIEDLSSSEIPTSTQEQQEWLKSNAGEWYDPLREYSTLFEKKYDLQRQRRMFVENEIKDAIPSIGYTYLVSLIERDFLNTVFTTNFDDLVNEAFFLYSNQRPVVCAHDSSINSITITSKRPKIIKLHGDYLFDDIKATERETESLDQNMKEKFMEFAKDYGLIVIGYAGCDRSIMDTLSLLLKNDDHFRNGVYWCIRKNSDVSEDLRRLLWRERVYFVEIDGFDELMAEMYFHLSKGELLPPAATHGKSRYESVIKRLIESPSAFPSTSKTLIAAKNIFIRQSKRKAIANLIVNPENNEKPLSQSELTDDDLLMLTSLERLQEEQKFEELVEAAKRQFETHTNSTTQDRIARMLVNGYLSLRQESNALALVDQMDSRNPYHTHWLLNRARIKESPSERFEILQKAYKRDPQSPDVCRALGSWHAEHCLESVGTDRKSSYDEAYKMFDESIICSPSKRNSSWALKYDLILKQEKQEAKKNELLNKLEEQLSNQGKYDWQLIRLKVDRLSNSFDKKNYVQLVSLIEDSKFRCSDEQRFNFDRLLMRSHAKAEEFEKVKSILDDLHESGKHVTNSSLAHEIAKTMRENFAMDDLAIATLKENLDSSEFNSNVFIYLIRSLISIKDFDEAELYLSKYSKTIKDSFELLLLHELLERKGKFSESLTCLDKRRTFGIPEDREARSYVLLMQKKFPEAQNYCQEYLNGISYSPEASAMLVNFYVAKRNLKQKPDFERLDAIVQWQPTNINKAAIAALKEHKRDCIDEIKNQMRVDKTFRFDVMRWPVFWEICGDSAITNLFSEYKYK